MTADPPPAAAPRQRARMSARVERVVDRAADTRSLFLSLAGGKRLRFVPGQFISIAIPLGDETRSRPYSIASSPEEPGPFEICFNRVAGGRGVEWLFGRAAGDPIEFIGPFGAFTLERAPEAEAGFVAEGTAIAPIRPMLLRALAGPARSKMHLLYGAPDAAHILYRADLDEMARANRSFTFETVLAPPAALYARLAQLAARRWIEADADRNRQFFICGVGAGVTALRDLLRGAGYERRAVHYEQW